MNKIYGILTANRVPSSSPFYRYSDIGRNSKQNELLNSLLPVDSDASFLGASADFIIRFLRCSTLWDSFIQDNDKLNSYKIRLNIKKSDVSNCISYNDLLDWFNNTAVDSIEYPVYEHAPIIDQIVNKLLTVMTLKDE